jgi:hypothetical protein
LPGWFNIIKLINVIHQINSKGKTIVSLVQKTFDKTKYFKKEKIQKTRNSREIHQHDSGHIYTISRVDVETMEPFYIADTGNIKLGNHFGNSEVSKNMTQKFHF